MVDAEIQAMGEIAKAMEGLEEDERSRVLRWASERYGGVTNAQMANGQGGRGSTGESGRSDEDDGGGTGAFEHFAELYEAVGPASDAERALTAAYWKQVVEGKSPFGSRELNDQLKNLGHGLSAANKAMSSNIAKKPALILQVSRGGSSQQARKKYKLTEAGVKWVSDRLD